MTPSSLAHEISLIFIFNQFLLGFWPQLTTLLPKLSTLTSFFYPKNVTVNFQINIADPGTMGRYNRPLFVRPKPEFNFSNVEVESLEERAMRWKREFDDKKHVYAIVMGPVFDLLRLIGSAPFYRDNTGNSRIHFAGSPAQECLSTPDAQFLWWGLRP